MQQMESLQGIAHIHLVGIGGIGVSALAPALLQRGIRVTGSDPARNAVTERLQALGIPIYHSHRPENIEGASLLVVTSAAKSTNPEIQAARRRGIPVWPRARMLGCLVNDRRGIVVTGAHGKTSITAMLAKAWIDLGLDPTAFVGGDLTLIGGNVRLGRSDWVIAEGDESDGSFVYLKPEFAIVNNIDADHLDFYADLDAIIGKFNEFIQGVKQNGCLFVSADCDHCRRLNIPSSLPVVTYGWSEHADVRAVNYRKENQRWCFDLIANNSLVAPAVLSVSGRHSVHNALSVLALGLKVGLPMDALIESLSTYTGVQRRMEVKGIAQGITVIDDYAHHPTEIQSTIQALRDRYPQRVIGIFQPHLYSRTVKLKNEFGRAFTGLDRLILTDIYAARDEPIEGVTGELLRRLIAESGVFVDYVHVPGDIPDFLLPILREGDVVVTFGAGDIYKVGEAILARLQQKEGSVQS